ncbi:hypothetical protein B0T26DRAFT_679588 [Lasiosphaeria miniovina]|uniref:LITAF domain-containing protein n=1 Tax=Lasiosphaeria miniovina TaxID=1954250 RepID=A0AA40A6T6_9PEZI|nr:uncharacterized protein B0T26DRAFT_679588 [Lasiosphaeria miniovina]KAK0710295.1 hypothetical protein B0T26DRAFT_679588 [Lasiosphaeria miniovina]
MQQPAKQSEGVAEELPPAYSPAQVASPGPDVSPATHLPADVNAQSKPLPNSPMAPGNAAVAAVTPLHLLGDYPQSIDCPFCHQRTQTRVEKVGTPMQMVAGVLCCLFCVCLACVPCMAGWFEETHYFCMSCKQRVAMRPDSGAIQVFGPQTLVPSQYPAAGPQTLVPSQYPAANASGAAPAPSVAPVVAPSPAADSMPAPSEK